MKTKKIELLAPAGSWEALKAAIANGADAVYLAGKNFGARAFAANFNHDDLRSAVRYAHIYGVKIYVTMNTLLNDFELKKAMQEVDFLYQIKVDAILIQDLGLYAEIKKHYPDMKLHASTQMHIHNVAGVRFAKALGLERAVIARETPLSLLTEMCHEEIEIEAFVHGAICVSYSGQCLLSSSLMNRSGNKGVCAQCCRLPYSLKNEETKLTEKADKFLLSTKDMNDLLDVPALIKAGVSSLKIEGRMKKPAYVGYITRQYREAIDSYYAGKEYVKDAAIEDNMAVLFNRGFTDAYLRNKDATDLYQQSSSNHRGISVGRVINYHHGRAYILLTRALAQFDGIRFADTQGDGFVVNRLYNSRGLLINRAKAGETIQLQVKNPPTKGTSLLKTSDYLLEESVAKEGIYRRLPVQVTLRGDIGENLTMCLRCEKDSVFCEANYKIEESQTGNYDLHKIRQHIDHFQDTPFMMEKCDVLCSTKAFLPVKILKELRRQACEKLLDKRAQGNPHQQYNIHIINKIVPPLKRPITEYTFPYQKTLGPENSIFCSESPEAGDYLLYPVINPKSEYLHSDCIVVSEVGGLLLDAPHKIAGMNLNCMNSSCVCFLRSLGCEAVVLSSELKEHEIKEILQKTNAHYFAYGRRDLMNLKWNPLLAQPQIEHTKAHSFVLKEKEMPLLQRQHRTVLLESKALYFNYKEGLGYYRFTCEKERT